MTKVTIEYDSEERALRALKAESLYSAVWSFLQHNLSDHREDLPVSKIREELLEELEDHGVDIYKDYT